MFFVILFLLLIISFLWAVWSLRGLQKDKRLLRNVKKDLATGRVIFHQEAHAQQHHSSVSSEEALVAREPLT